MTTTPRRIQPIENLPPLSNRVTTRDGAAFDSNLDEWFVENIQFGCSIIKWRYFTTLSSSAKHKLKLALAHYAENASYAHFQNIFSRLLGFYREELAELTISCETITLAHLLNYRSKQSPETEWKLGVLRILFLDMEALGYSICSSEAVHYLLDSTIKGNMKGTSVRVHHPHDGPFNDSELLSIQSTLNRAYAVGDLDLPTFTLGWLFLAYGLRPIQIAALKEKDLVVSSDASGARFYTLLIPSAKRRGQGIRAAFKTRYCSKQIGHLLELLIEKNRPLKTDPKVPDTEWPFFIGRREGDLPGLSYHTPSHYIGRRLRALERITGLKTNPKRFRMTLAQRAVDDGKDPYTVAELLDHSDTQNVKVYYEAGPATVERLDRHLAMELAPLAQAFAGVVVPSETTARRGHDLSSRIYDKTLPNNIDRPLGTCGQLSFCGLYAPFAC